MNLGTKNECYLTELQYLVKVVVVQVRNHFPYMATLREFRLAAVSKPFLSSKPRLNVLGK